MNCERLHKIALEMRRDLDQTTSENTLKQLVSALQNQVNQPQDPSHQQQVSTHRKTLQDALDTAPSNEFSPAWRQTLTELGADRLLGHALRQRVEEIFERNQITPSVALEELRAIHQDLQKLKESLDHVIAGFEQLGIGSEELQPGQCEVGVLIPRPSVDNMLNEFGQELREFDSIFGTFAEVATGSRPGFAIRSVSSTDLNIFLDMAPQIAACIAVAVERIVALYKNLLEIRKLRQELADHGVPDPNLSGISEYATTGMSDEIEKLIPELLDRYYQKKDGGRRNELTIALRFALRKIAARIDKGYNIEIRAEPAPEQEQVAEDGTPSQKGAHIDAIRSASKTLQFIKAEGDPILRLPESEEHVKDKK